MAGIVGRAQTWWPVLLLVLGLVAALMTKQWVAAGCCAFLLSFSAA